MPTHELQRWNKKKSMHSHTIRKKASDTHTRIIIAAEIPTTLTTTAVSVRHNVVAATVPRSPSHEGDKIKMADRPVTTADTQQHTRRVPPGGRSVGTA